MSEHDEPANIHHRPDILGSDVTLGTVSGRISSIVLTQPLTLGWLLATGFAFSFALLLFVTLTMLCVEGVGIWGINIPVAWGFAITNFVWWIGIGHAGTLISAILLLLHQKWRTSINRFAEAMTLFAVACAGIFPLFHMGRPWLFYWLAPYPDTMGLWPQWRSPLVWDVFAVSTYGTVSLLFWYVGLIPDLATLRDRSRNRFAQMIYGVLALGWRGSARHWKRYESAYLLLAGIATPLVVSVHTVVSFDFSVGIVPGWHSTIFPPYFVAGAIFSGFAMVITIAVPLRYYYHLEDFITLRHLENMAKVMLATGLIVAYGYLMEGFMAWYSGDLHDIGQTIFRATGTYAPEFWGLMFCNVLVPQLIWFSRIRKSTFALFWIAMLVNVGMWLERFIIVVSSLSHDFLPSAFRTYVPTFWDFAALSGSLGLFVSLMLLFIRFLPVISISEMSGLVAEVEREEEE